MSDWPYPYLGRGYDAWKLAAPTETPCDSCPEAGKCGRVPTECWKKAKREIELEAADHE